MIDSAPIHFPPSSLAVLSVVMCLVASGMLGVRFLKRAAGGGRGEPTLMFGFASSILAVAMFAQIVAWTMQWSNAVPRSGAPGEMQGRVS